MIKGVRRSSGTELQTTCPKCGREKMFVNLRKKLGWCFYCATSYDREDVRRMGLEEDFTTFTAVMGNDTTPLELVAPDTDMDAKLFLAGRGVKAKDYSSSIRYSPKLRRLFFRIQSPTSSYAPAWHTRSIDPGKGWVCQTGVQKQHYWFGWRGEVLCVVEGIWDAMSLHERGCNAIALLGTKMSQTHLKGIVQWPGLRQVVVWLDDDAAGIKATEKIANQLEPVVETVVCVEGYPEPSESDEVPKECYALYNQL